MHVTPRDQPITRLGDVFSGAFFRRLLAMDPTQVVLSYTGQGPYAGGEQVEVKQEENGGAEQQGREG